MMLESKYAETTDCMTACLPEKLRGICNSESIEAVFSMLLKKGNLAC